MTPARTWRVSRYGHKVVAVKVFGCLKKKGFPHMGNVLQMGGDGIGVNPSRRGKLQEWHLSRRNDVSRRPPSPPEEVKVEEEEDVDRGPGPAPY